jgi:hypothetical protein
LSLLDKLEKARQYKAAFAIYRYMVKSGYDFYENTLLNDVFKRLVNVAAKGIDVASPLTSAAPLDTLMKSGQEFSSTYSSAIEIITEKLGGSIGKIPSKLSNPTMGKAPVVKQQRGKNAQLKDYDDPFEDEDEFVEEEYGYSD